MRSAPLLVFICVTAAAVAFMLSTVDQLPDTVATHFGRGNQADGWMTRNGYARYMLCSLILFPATLVAAIGLLPRLMPNYTNLPNRKYWMHEERREATVQYLATHAAWFGCLLVGLITGAHYAILEAHRTQPPVLPAQLFLSLLVGFLLCMLVWGVALYRRFGRLPAGVSSPH